MSLPAAWVDRIFDRLAIVYGEEFLARWRAVNMADVKTDWANTLGYYEADPGAIAWALENLPSGKPPTVLQFRDLCRQAPAPEVPRLPEPKAGPKRVAAEVAKLRGHLAATIAPTHDGKAWADVILARAAAGERVAPYALACAKVARGLQVRMEG